MFTFTTLIRGLEKNIGSIGWFKMSF